MDTVTLRPGNKALDYMANNCSDRFEHFDHLVRCLPQLAAALSREAQSTSESLLKPKTLREHISQVFSDKGSILADCAFDLMLIPCFEEVTRYCGDNELASCYVDAVLYQATGRWPEIPTESQVLYEGTHHTHGITKYKIARDYIKEIPDLAAWIFGKEYSAIVAGTPKDVVRIMAVLPFTLLFRQHARWKVKYFLYGTLPSENEKQQLNSLVQDVFEKAAKGFGQIGGKDAEVGERDE